MKLAISLPTRGRPERVLDTVARSVVNWRHPETVLWVMADHDDPPTHEAAHKLERAYPDRVKLSVKEREDTIAEKWNRILDLEPKADVYLAGADDDPYITAGYDKLILEAAARFPDGIGMVYGHMANASFSRAVAPTRGLVEKMGYMFPTYFPYWFVDHWTDDVAKLIGRISFADIMTDQTQPGATQELREVDWWSTWFDAAYLLRRQQARNIILSNDFETPTWHKEILLRNPPLIEFHSRWTNNHVRQQKELLHKALGAKFTDNRYYRVKQKAIEMIPHLLNDYGMPPGEAEIFRQMLAPQISQPAPNMLQRAWA